MRCDGFEGSPTHRTRTSCAPTMPTPRSTHANHAPRQLDIRLKPTWCTYVRTRFLEYVRTYSVNGVRTYISVNMFCACGMHLRNNRLRRVILLVSAILADEHLHDAVVTCGTSGNIDEHHAADVVLGYVVASLPAGQTLAAESPSWRCDRCHLESCNGSATFSGL